MTMPIKTMKEVIMNHIQTTCPYCGCGCNIDLLVENDRIVKAEPTQGHPVNHGELCLKGLYGWEFVHSPERLTKPLIRKKNGQYSKEGELCDATWEEAFSLIKEKILSIKNNFGPDYFMGLSSARCTNEENYLFQKFFRTVLGTNNIDHCARL